LTARLLVSALEKNISTQERMFYAAGEALAPCQGFDLLRDQKMEQDHNRSTATRALRMLAVAGACAASMIGAPSSLAVHQELALLDRLQGGQWEVRDRDSIGGRSRMCIDSGRQLIQLRHMRETCKSFTIEDTAEAVTVQYTCPGHGFGRTRVRFENAQLAQVETQGVAHGLPFDMTTEARRVGTCQH
jgi:hypothetical protein